LASGAAQDVGSAYEMDLQRRDTRFLLDETTYVSHRAIEYFIRAPFKLHVMSHHP